LQNQNCASQITTYQPQIRHKLYKQIRFAEHTFGTMSDNTRIIFRTHHVNNSYSVMNIYSLHRR